MLQLYVNRLRLAHRLPSTVIMKFIIFIMALIVCCLVATSLAAVSPNSIGESKLAEIEEKMK